MQKRKAVTCHAGARDEYQLSIALENQGLLERLITDLYLPSLLGKKIKKKYSEDLPFKKVKSVLSSYFRQTFLEQPYTTTDKILTGYALKEAIKKDVNLFLYSYTAFDAFDFVKEKRLPILCLLFQLHPHPLSIIKLLNEELALSPYASQSIIYEPEMNLSEIQIKILGDESKLADHIVVASTYTKKTLIENKINPEKITVIPYGVNANKFPFKPSYNMENGKIKLVFVGQMIQRKGLGYLLEAVKLLNSKNNIELVLIGRGGIDTKLLDKYKHIINLNIKINIKPNELIKELHSSDILLFPSLIEGFGHVILEAMSVGLPVICTPNTAGPDVFTRGDEGIIVEIRNSEMIAEKIEYFINKKRELKAMGISAGKTAREFTWERFRASIVEFYSNFS
jgi:glycosyltransferase involved in cell wall biosynthesis